MPNAQVVEVDVTDEIAKGGPAFGDFLKSLGLAVAESQSRLDETLTTTAKRLSETKIQTVAIYEQVLDDDGKLTQGNALLQELPLANYITPTAYHFARVHLQAEMKVAEFNGARGFNIQGKSSAFSAKAKASYGITSGFGASGNLRKTSTSYERSTEASVSQDTAAGTMSLEATLEPRGDISLPSPFVIQKGPRLTASVGSVSDIVDGNNNVTGRQVELTITLQNSAGQPLVDKLVEFRLDNADLNFATTPNTGKTDNAGNLKIMVKREGAAYDPAKPREPTTALVWLGLLSQTRGITI